LTWDSLRRKTKFHPGTWVSSYAGVELTLHLFVV
jgi:hypothetical protein